MPDGRRPGRTRARDRCRNSPIFGLSKVVLNREDAPTYRRATRVKVSSISGKSTSAKRVMPRMSPRAFIRRLAKRDAGILDRSDDNPYGQSLVALATLAISIRDAWQALIWSKKPIPVEILAAPLPQIDSHFDFGFFRFAEILALRMGFWGHSVCERVLLREESVSGQRTGSSSPEMLYQVDTLGHPGAFQLKRTRDKSKDFRFFEPSPAALHRHGLVQGGGEEGLLWPPG